MKDVDGKSIGRGLVKETYGGVSGSKKKTPSYFITEYGRYVLGSTDQKGAHCSKEVKK